jgi:hypothetical protein
VHEAEDRVNLIVIQVQTLALAIADLAAQAPRLAQGGFFQASGRLQAVGGEVLVGDAVLPEVMLQPAAVGQAA